MLRVDAKPLIDASELIGQLMNAVLDPAAHSFDPATVRVISDKLDRLIEQLSALNLQMTKTAASRLKTHINIEGITPAQCRSYLHQTRDRLFDEIELTYLLSLSSKESHLYECASPMFGATVETYFPSAAYDINEASKCLALSRTTASVFHSIRTLEAAIRAMSRCLEITDPTKASGKNWGMMLRTLKEEMDRRWPNASNRQTGDGRTFDELYTSLAAIQNPWRNATMHLDQKYTMEEAQHIFDVVGALMRRLADRCDENGLPLAAVI